MSILTANLKDLFHHLWGKAHDGPNYVKAEWQELELRVFPALPAPAVSELEGLHYACVACTRPQRSHGMCPQCSKAWGIGRIDGLEEAAQFAKDEDSGEMAKRILALRGRLGQYFAKGLAGVRELTLEELADRVTLLERTFAMLERKQ